MHLAVIARHDIYPVEENSLDRGLPRPEAKRIVRKWGVIRIEHERRARGKVARWILYRASKTSRPFDQFGFKHVSRSSLINLREHLRGIASRLLHMRNPQGFIMIRAKSSQ